MNNDGVKISEMPELSAIHDSTVVAGVSKGINYKIPAKLLKGTSTKVEVEKEDGKVTINVTDDEGETSTDFNVPTDEQLTNIDEIPTIKQDLADEIADRKQADSEMDTAIKAEAETRKEADDTLTEKIEAEARKREDSFLDLQDRIDEAEGRLEEADTNLQSQIDALADRSDVVDVVGTHEELEEYGTANLGDNDIVKVLNDETHDGAITYYRWNKAEGEWSYVGETGPYYTKAETDEKFQGVNHDIENLTELMPAVVQETGDSERDVMSQKAVTDALANAGSAVNVVSEYGDSTEDAISQKFVSDKLNDYQVVLGKEAKTTGNSAIAIGLRTATAGQWSVALGADIKEAGPYGVAIGHGAAVTSGVGSTTEGRVAIGRSASCSNTSSVAIGYASKTTRDKEFSIGTTGTTRYLANVTAGELDTDATNLAQVRDLISQAGGGSSVTLLSAYKASPEKAEAYDAGYVNNRLNSDVIAIGPNSIANGTSTTTNRSIYIGNSSDGLSNNILIGWALSQSPSPSGVTTQPSDNIIIGRNSQVIGGAGSTGWSGNNAIVMGTGVSAGSYSVAIGDQAKAEYPDSVAVGRGTKTAAQYSVALGDSSATTRYDEVSIGAGPDASVHQTRYLANVTAGRLDTDATNVAQVRDMISQAGGGVDLLSEYTTEDIDGKAYDAGYINSKLDSDKTLIGFGAATSEVATNRAVVIGRNAYTTANTSKYNIDHSVVIGEAASVTASSAGSSTSHSSNSVAIGYSAKATNTDDRGSVAIGYLANAKTLGSVAIGERASADSGGSSGVAVGLLATVSNISSVALGNSSATAREYEVSIGSGNTAQSYGTRYLANVKAGTLDTDAVNKKQMEDYVAEHSGGSSVEVLDEYKGTPEATDVYSASYTNGRLNGKATALGNLASTSADGRDIAIGQSAKTTARTGSTGSAIAIGGSATSGDINDNSSTIAIGSSATAARGRSIAIGTSANTGIYEHSVALGDESVVSRDREVSIAWAASGNVENQTRFLANVRDGVKDQDAVTVHQLNAAVGNINTLLETLINGEGAKA